MTDALFDAPILTPSLGPILSFNKSVDQYGSERWHKQLAAQYPAAYYWLGQEFSLLHRLQDLGLPLARPLSLDQTRGEITLEVSGQPLTHWLCCPVGELAHPFQRSSELIRLILACLDALAAISQQGVVHGGLRPDILLLGQTSSNMLDFSSLKIADLGFANSRQLPIAKPLFIDLASADSASLSPAMRNAVRQDWQRFAKLCGEPLASSWAQLSPKAQAHYAHIQMSELSVHKLDWRDDLYALAHWFKQISLYRIDYCHDSHRSLTELLRKMQKSALHGGFKSLAHCQQVLAELPLNPHTLAIANPPHSLHISAMQPSPALIHSVAVSQPTQPSRPPATPRSHAKPKLSLWTAAGITLLLTLSVAAIRWRGSSPPPEMAQISAPSHHLLPQAPPSSAYEGLSLAALRQAAESGEAAAQAQLGFRYRKGVGMPTDKQMAAAWYRHAADQLHPEGQAYLGYMYMSGQGASPNPEQAEHYSKLAASQGHPTAQYNLALLYWARDPSLAYRWMQQAALQEPSMQAALNQLAQQLSPAQRVKATSPDAAL